MRSCQLIFVAAFVLTTCWQINKNLANHISRPTVDGLIKKSSLRAGCFLLFSPPPRPPRLHFLLSPVFLSLARPIWRPVRSLLDLCLLFPTKKQPLRRPQETHTLCVFDRLPVVSWRRAKYKQMYGLKKPLLLGGAGHLSQNSNFMPMAHPKGPEIQMFSDTKNTRVSPANGREFQINGTRSFNCSNQQ